ncbi:MAG: DUF1622 domain-containing protein [Myxococcota bacterium]
MEAIHPALLVVAEVIDLIGIAIVLLGAVKFLVMFAEIEAKRLVGRECTARIQEARRALGGYILVALEFMIASDVIGSVLSRSLESLANLGAIVVLRTAMGFFLERELKGEPAEVHDNNPIGRKST